MYRLLSAVAKMQTEIIYVNQFRSKSWICQPKTQCRFPFWEVSGRGVFVKQPAMILLLALPLLPTLVNGLFFFQSGGVFVK